MKLKKNLIICEKPSVALEFSKALGLKKTDGYYEGDKYVVTWCIGHLCELKNPHEYDEKWKKWNLESLPIIPKKYELKIKGEDAYKKRFSIIKKLLNSDEFSAVINACDAGREGELIFQNVYKMSSSNLEIFRMWTSAAINEETIRRELNNLKPMSKYEGLANAARARECADWAVGMNATRALTLAINLKNHEVFSVGRVQTPTLSFIVKREKEIKEFKEKKFYEIKAILEFNNVLFDSTHQFKNIDNNKTETRFHEISEVSKILSKIINIKKAQLKEITDTKKIEHPPLLFSLTELQKEANKRFGYSAQQTLDIAQVLYEKHKILSYPRTDSSHLPMDLVLKVPTILKSLSNDFENIKHFINKIIENNNYMNNKRVFDDSKVSDHHALIPMGSNFENLSNDEFNIYNLVCMRLIASFLNDYIEINRSLIFDISGFEFISKGKTPIENGWKDVYNLENFDDNIIKETNQKLPNIKKGEISNIEKIEQKEGKTSPPKRYTEASILEAMESPSRFLNNELVSEKEILKEKGLGTPATRAKIIESMLEREYCIKKGKNLIPTKKAISLIKNLEPESLRSPVLTALWEQKLSDIENNKYSLSSFSKDLNLYIEEIINKSQECGKKIKIEYLK